MVPHEIDGSGICGTCKVAAQEHHILECHDCERRYHSDCNDVVPYATRTYLKHYNGLRNKSNFLFVCNHCVTDRENREASTLKDQMADVVAAVERLSKEVSELKGSRNVDPEPSPSTSAAAVKVSGPVKPLGNAWNNPSKVEQLKQDIKKVTVCVKNDGERRSTRPQSIKKLEMFMLSFRLKNNETSLCHF